MLTGTSSDNDQLRVCSDTVICKQKAVSNMTSFYTVQKRSSQFLSVLISKILKLEGAEILLVIVTLDFASLES